MGRDIVADEWFKDDGEPPQPVEINDYLLKLRKLFVVIDAVVKTVIVSPEAGKGTADEGKYKAQAPEENDATKEDTSMREYEEYLKSRKNVVTEPAEKVDFDQPD